MAEKKKSRRTGCLIWLTILGGCGVVIYRETIRHELRANEGRDAVRPGMTLREAITAAKNRGMLCLAPEPVTKEGLQVWTGAYSPKQREDVAAAMSATIGATTTASSWTAWLGFHRGRASDDFPVRAWVVLHVDARCVVTKVEPGSVDPPDPDLKWR